MIKIGFSDFWPGFDHNNNVFMRWLSERYEIKLDNEKPDFLFFSVFGNRHKEYKCKKIFYTGENKAPNFLECDYAFSFDYLEEGERHYRLPYYLFVALNWHPTYYYSLIQDKVITKDLATRNFCNFVYSNRDAKRRVEFFRKLSQYKKVDAGGSCENNIGYRVEDKLSFQRQYKFSIAFENGAYRPTGYGYTTEKIVDAMTANTIPIYYGNPIVDREFNRCSFLNWHEYQSDEALIERIIELDQDEDKYLEMLKQSWLPENKIPEQHKEENIKRFFFSIFEDCL